LFLAGGLVAFIFTMLTNLEFFYVLQVETAVLEEVVAQELPMPDISMIMQASLANLIIFVPFALVLNLAFERVAFSIARLTGGKGTLGQHLLLASVVWLAVSMSLAASLFGPFQCLSVITIASMVFLTLLYLLTYTSAKAYSIAHSITMAHALTINILLMIPRIAVWFYLAQATATILGLPVEGG
jgi:hypothetical protein